MILGRKISKENDKKPLEIEDTKTDETKPIDTQTQNKETESETNEIPENKISEEKNPPIFIKIDKYREILSSLTEMKVLIHKIISNIALIQKVEEIEAKAFENSRKMFEEFNSKLDELSVYFMAKSSGMEKIPEMEELKRLEEEIEKLKKSLEE